MFKKSSYCGGNGCVEVEMDVDQDGDRVIRVRDSKQGDNGPVLMFNRAEWQNFLDGAADGEFDLPRVISEFAK